MMKMIKFLLIVLFFLTTSALAKEVTLQWDANTESDLSGYKVYYGLVSGSYTSSHATQGASPIIVKLSDLPSSNAPEFTLTGLSDYRKYFFSVTATDYEELESDFSNEVFADRVYNSDEEGVPPDKPANLKRIWKMVKRFFKFFNPWKANLRVIDVS